MKPDHASKVVENSWSKILCRLSLPSSSNGKGVQEQAEEGGEIESCQIQISAGFPFLFRKPVFIQETSANGQKNRGAGVQNSGKQKLKGNKPDSPGFDDLDFSDSVDPLDRTPPDQEHLDPAAGDEEDSSEEEEEGGFGRFSGGGGGFVSDSITICELDIDSILQTYQMPLYFSHSNKFISPRDSADQDQVEMEQRRKLRQRSNTGVMLDLEKHKLRLEQARRIDRSSCLSARLEPTNDPKQPVNVNKENKQASEHEIKLKHNVDRLQKNYDSMRMETSRKPKTTALFSSPRGQQSPRSVTGSVGAKRLLIYKNGHDWSVRENIMSVWASSMNELLHFATERLSMGFAARVIYTPDGSEVTNFNDIHSGQLLCVSQGESFVNFQDAKRRLFLKARWARDNRLKRDKEKTESCDDVKPSGLNKNRQHVNIRRRGSFKEGVIRPNIALVSRVNPLGGSMYTDVTIIDLLNPEGDDSQQDQKNPVSFLTQLPVF